MGESMTSPVFDPQQQPTDTAVEPAGPEFEVYTPAFVPPQQEQVVPAAPVPPKPKRTGVVVIAVFTVLLFGAAGTFGTLFFLEKKHSADLSTQIEGKDREIADLGQKAKDNKDEAVKASDAQKKAESALKKAEDEASRSQQCRDAARALRAAALANDEAKGEAAGMDIFVHC